MPLLVKIYSQTIKSIRRIPLVLVPFLIFTIVELFALGIMYYAPRMPLRAIFGPPIRTFWGESFLHYPSNFLLLPKVFSLSKMVLYVIIGSLCAGMAIPVITDIYDKKKVNLWNSFKLSIKKYAILFSIILLLVLLIYTFAKLINFGIFKIFSSGRGSFLFLKAGLWRGPISVTLSFLFSLLLQSAFIYAIPVLMIDNESFIRSIMKSFIMLKRFFPQTLIIVGLPMCFYVPIIILNYNAAFLVYNFCPESILWIAVTGILLSSLIIDPLMTISATFLYLIKRRGHKEPA